MRISLKPEREYPFWVRWILRSQKKKYGEVVPAVLVWARSPKLLMGLNALYDAIDRNNSPLDKVLRSLVMARVSQVGNTSIKINGEGLQKRGVPAEKIRGLVNYDKSNAFSEKERAALAYADAITRTSKQS